MHSTLIAVAELGQKIDLDTVRIIDCRFALAEPTAGRKAYRLGHIPGAVYADLAQDLSGPANSDRGRHPLPSLGAMCETFSRLGIWHDRDPQRYRSEVEPLDPRAGHIPGAKNHFFKDNLDSDGIFRAALELKQAFRGSLGTLPGYESVHYCGSGVSACHNILAQMNAGLDEPRLFCGSWSEWCGDPERPAAMGDEIFND